MRRTLIFTALVFVPLFSFARGLQREVLFTMNEHEFIYDAEYISTNSFDGYRYSCMLYDTLRDEYYLIWNGIRKNVTTTDYYTHNYDFYYIDLIDYENSIYIYSTDEGQYLHMDRKTWGPYSNVWLRCEGGVLNEFCFERIGDDDHERSGFYYLHDYDGVIRKNTEQRFHYKSPNNVHTAELSKNRRRLRIDEKTYILPFPTDDSLYGYDKLFLLNDGSCYYYTTGLKSGYYIKIKNYIVSVYDVGNWWYDELEFREQLLKEDMTGFDMWPVVQYFYDPGWVHDEQSDSWFLSFEFNLTDKEEKHVFHADWKQKGVLIDGRRYGKTCPFSAFYDENKNAFVWVVQEGQQIVRYSFQL